MGLYIKFEDVRIRLLGKVRFTEDEDDENKMHIALANRLINEAEGQVEQHLSPRYAAPFVTDADGPFSALPDRPTRELIRTLCEHLACLRILETDFGRGSSTDGDKYAKALAARYEKLRNSLLARRTDGNTPSQGWKYPPLPGLKLNYMNTEADDGYMGSVIVASGDSTRPGYAQGQVNDPSVTFWNGVLSGDG